MQYANNQAWVRNPLTVIAIFAAVAESFGAGVLPFLEGEVQDIFVRFVMFFPCALVGLFFFVLWFKPDALYAPADFKTDAAYLQNRGFQVFNTSGNDKDSQTYAFHEDRPHEAHNGAAPPGDAFDSAPDPEQSTNGAAPVNNGEVTPSDAAPSPVGRPQRDGEHHPPEIHQMLGSLYVASLSPDLQDALKTNEKAWGTILKSGISQLAESMAVNNIAKKFGGRVTAPAIVQADDKPMEIDAFIDSPAGPVAVEVITGSSKGLTFKIERASLKLGIMRNSMPSDMQAKFRAVVAVVSTSAEQQRQLKKGLKPLDYSSGQFEIIYLNLEDLIREDRQ